MVRTPDPRRSRLLVWICIGLVLGFLYLPLLPPILFSLQPAAGADGIGFGWYLTMWQTPLLAKATVTTLETGLIVALAAPLLGLAAAMAIRELRAPRLMLLLMLLPLFIPGVSMGLASAFFFKLLGIAPSLLTIAIVQTLWALPFATLVILTAMSGFDPVYLEAAYMGGANRLRAFLDIELPLIWPGISGAAIFSLVLSFNETIRTSLVQGPLNTVQTYIWSTYKQIGLSPALYALMSLLILVTLALVGASLLARTARDRTASQSEIGL